MFITLEGIEGAGKTTQMPNIVAFIEARGYECATTREPGGTAVGVQIRKVLLDPSNRDMDAGTELLLYVADRVQHIRTVIQPHLMAGRVVVCDRFFDATLVYQGYARGLDKELIRGLHRLVCDDLRPDATLLFDLAPAVGLARAWREIDSGGRTSQETRFENETLAFHQKVRDGYLDLARRDPQRYRLIDAHGDAQQVSRAVQEVLTMLLPERR
ncbi:MAG: dTMP kinase [Desulfobacterales bacterium]|nr:dTMP kinase [Desulfobacterales bacterium]